MVVSGRLNVTIGKKHLQPFNPDKNIGNSDTTQNLSLVLGLKNYDTVLIFHTQVRLGLQILKM